jgi:hypothetical protein
MFPNYNQYNDAFSNSDNMELDKLARELNNKRKAHKKANQNYKSFTKGIAEGISSYNDKNQFNFLPASCNDSQDNLSSNNNDLYNISNSSSLDDINPYISDEEISSNYSSLPKKEKKSLRMNSNHLNHFKPNDDSKILSHLKKCSDCKNQLFELLQKKHNKYNLIDNTQKQYDNNTFIGLQDSELKNILIVIVIGIIIIIFIDILLF